MNRVRASEACFRTLAENIREVFWVASAAKPEMLYVSPGYEAIWGRTCQSLFDAPGSWLDAIHPADQPRVRAWVSTQRQGSTEITYRIVRPDGSMRWIRDRAVPVRDERHEVMCIVGLADDITAVIQTEERLAHSQKLEALGRLAGGVAHDFNNLLSVVMSCADFLLGKLEPGDIRADAETIRHAAETAADLTRQLLVFSRLQILQPTMLDLGAMLARMKKMLARIVGDGIDVVLSTSTSPTRIYADAGQIERVIMNIAVNARDAMPGGGSLAIEVSSVTLDEAQPCESGSVEPGTYVALTVTDTGVGMDAETRRRIFEPFFTTKEKGRGTGLGLATVLGIVQQSAGTIRVESAPGEGAAFRILFPTPACEAAAPALAPPETDRPGGTETILLAEDDPQVRAAARTTLRRCGYTVLEAENAGDALLVSEQHRGRIHLLLCDVAMRRMSGTQLAKRLARARSEMKVLYMTGYSGDALARYGSFADGAPVFLKPIVPDTLARKVREVLA